jgi:hemerythrin
LMSKQKKMKDNKFEFEQIEQEITARLAKVTTFLQKSLIHHILKEDKEYSKFFISIQNKAQKSGWLSSLVK